MFFLTQHLSITSSQDAYHRGSPIFKKTDALPRICGIVQRPVEQISPSRVIGSLIDQSNTDAPKVDIVANGVFYVYIV